MNQYNPDKLIAFYELRKARKLPEELNACCPFQHYKPDRGLYYESSPSFSINLRNGKWNCMGCGMAGHDLNDLSFKLEKPLYPYAREVREEYVELTPTIEVGNYLLPTLSMNQHLAIEYLNSRRIPVTPEIARDYHIGASIKGDRMYYPLLSPRGKLEAWMERDCRPEAVNRWYLHPEYVNRAGLLFGIHNCKSRHGILVESPVDCLKLVSCGYTSVATCGAKFSDRTIERVLDALDTVYIIPHNDRAGKGWAVRSINRLYDRCDLYGVPLPSKYKDVAEVPDDSDIDEILSRAFRILEPVSLNN